MKHTATILFILTVALCLFCASLVLEMRDKDRLNQLEIDGLKRRNEAERDSLELILKLKDDSLKIAFETIKQATAEREERHRITQRTIADLRKIIFVSHTDSSRQKELKELYKSYTP